MELVLTLSRIVLVFRSPKYPLLNIFNLSLGKGIFPDELKIARVTPIYKTGDENDFRNYISISVLSCFSKMLERIMYKRLCKSRYYIRNNLAFRHSTEHAIIQLIDQINSSFEKNHFRLFDTVDHNTLVANLEDYGVSGNNLNCFQSYFKSRKKYLNFNNKIIFSSQITCSVPQGSVLEPFVLDLCYDLSNASGIFFFYKFDKSTLYKLA